MKKLSYEINDYDILDTHKDHAIVRAKIVNVGVNNNMTSFTKEAIRKAIPTLYNIPLIGIYNDLEEDFKSHAKNDREKKQTYAVGTIPESCNAHFEKDLMGMEYLVADIVVWKEYFPDFFEVIARNEENERQTTISMEISLFDYEDVDGIFDIKDFSFNGICLLGANVKPGIPNAGLRVLRFEEGKIDIEDISLYESLIRESNVELELLSKYSEKALSVDNGHINKKFEKGEVGNMSEKKETLAENLDEVISENREEKVDPTQTEATETLTAKETKKEETDSKEDIKAGKEKEKTAKGREDEKDDMKKDNKDAQMEETKKAECEAKEDNCADMECHPEAKEDMACGEKVEEMEDKKAECEEAECEDEKPLSKAERKTYQANEKAYQEKIAYLKSELAAYKPYKAMYEQAEKEIKELLEYKEEAELNKLEQQKSDYFKTFGVTQFDEEDRDEIIKKINDYNFSYQDFKAFMADKVQKYGMKTRFQNITEVINMYSEQPDVAAKYAESEVISDEDKILDRYTSI